MKQCKRVVALLLAVAMMAQMNITALAEVSLPQGVQAVAGTESESISAASSAEKTETQPAESTAQSEAQEDAESTSSASSAEKTETQPAESTAQSEAQEDAESTAQSEANPAASEIVSSQPEESEKTPENTENEEPTGSDEADVYAQENGTALQAASYQLDTIDKLRGALTAAGISYTDNNDTIATVNAGSYNALILLSNADPTLYENAAIQFTITGSDADLTGKAAVNSVDYTFQGLGSKEHPFAGTIKDGSSNNITTFTLNRALFNGVVLSGNNNYILNWTSPSEKAPSEAIFADYIKAEKAQAAEDTASNDTALALSVTAKATGNESASITLKNSFLGEVNGDLHLSIVLDAAGNSTSETYTITGYQIEQSGNAGLIANTVSDGTLTVDSAQLGSDADAPVLLNSKTVSMNSTGGHAGLLVGEVAENAGFAWTQDAQIAPAGSSSATGGLSAGGLIGSLGESAAASISAAVTLDTVTVKATANDAGGLIGSLGESAALTVTGAVTLTGTTEITGRQNAGGIAGSAGKSAVITLDNAVKLDTVTVTATANDAGGLAGSLGAGALLTLGADTTAKSLTVEAAAGDAGGVVGKADSTADTPTKLNFGGSVTLTQGTVSAGDSAGGFAGDAGSDMTITLAAEKTIALSGITSVVGVKAGGFAGTAQDLKIYQNAENNTAVTQGSVSPAVTTIGDKSKTTHAGGWFGEYTATTGTEEETKNLTNAFEKNIGSDSNSMKLNIKASGNAGGLFGVLALGKTDEEQGVRFVVQEKEIYAEWCLGSTGTDTLGGIAGQVTGQSKKDTLIVKKCTEKRTKSGSLQAKYNGGLAGLVETAAVQTDTFTAYEPFPYSNKSFGGVVGKLGVNCVLIAKNTTLDTSITDTPSDQNDYGDGSIWGDSEGSGGVVGHACDGSVVQLSGTTNLQKVWFAATATQLPNAGLLVGMQDNALIYAIGSGDDTGWTLHRSKDKKEKDKTEADNRAANLVDDIGNYGEVYRLYDTTGTGAGLASDLFALNENNEITIGDAYNNKSQDYTGEVSLANKNEFALFAIAVQSGIFNSGTRVSISDKTISIENNIDLTGTGVTGITRDNGDQQYNNVTLNGNGHSITLKIGEEYGKAYNVSGEEDTGKTSCNDGRIFSHGYLGLFAKVQKLTINNLTINESIRTLTRTRSGNTHYVGAAAAYADEATLQNTKVNVTIDQGGAYYYAGGIFGYAKGTIDIDQNTAVTVNYNYDGQKEIPHQTDNNNPFSNKVKALTGVYIGGAIGYLADSATVNLNDLTLSGSIKPQTDKEYTGSDFTAGGLIAYAQNAAINIRKTAIAGFTMESKASSSMGGFAGYEWRNCTVKISPANGQTDPALKITNSALTCTGNAAVGGLAYKASKTWQIDANGIDFGSAEGDATQIKTNGELGVLIYNSRYSYKDNKNNDVETALYFNMTANWDEDSAYKLGSQVVPTANGTSGNHAVFDEVIAYTATDDNITLNGQSILSLATTKPDETTRKVIMDGKNCNTYQNRTEYGKKNGTTNSHSRYYYNLQQIADEEKTQGTSTAINTPERLMLWSVRWYAHATLADYFTYTGDSITSELDMNGYSYYPIHIVNESVTVQNADIVFYNREIEHSENAQNDKKVTSSTDSQHYTMHAGLLLSFTQTNTDSSTNHDITLKVEDTYLSGSVGTVDGSSGALVIGSVKGNAAGKANISINGLKMYQEENGTAKNTALSVTDHQDGEVHPLLVGSITGYSNVTAAGVYGKNALPEGVTNAASSLIGAVGGTTNDTDQLVMNFSQIVLPDTKGYFTDATLLQSFQFPTGKACSATYNFTSAEDASADNKQVTYGREISGSKQYTESGQQKWYYDKAAEAAYEGLVTDKSQSSSTDFSAYLPYVKTGYSAADHYEEIKVNHNVVNFIEHCGTYSDPYVISNAAQLKALSSYTRGSGRPEYITIVNPDTPNKQNAFCDGTTTKAHTDYQYNGSVWVSGTATAAPNGIVSFEQDTSTDAKQLSDEMVKEYIRNAYYVIDADITVSDFNGLGLANTPFRGVLAGKDNATYTITFTGSSSGLINYSYGSVVKDLAVIYNAEVKTEEDGSTKTTGHTLTYTAPSAEVYNYALPNSFFGGIIGCVMGGDNIIDGVTVQYGENAVALSGNNTHLIPVGGYVGVVAGGGVIFRNSNKGTGTSAKTMQGAAPVSDGGLYHSGIIGRVLNGFAFSEGVDFNSQSGCSYQVNQITPDASDITVVTASGKNTVSLKDAQSLLVFSAIVNSGAAGKNNTTADNSSIAYYGDGAEKAYPYASDTNATKTNVYFFGGRYGKSRTANYNKIGQVSSTDPEWMTSQEDDCKQPGENSPYLITAYANGSTALQSLTASATNITLTADQTYDMTSYGSGYQGIGGRYRSLAMLNTSSKVDFATNPVRMKIADFNGSSAAIAVDMQVKEYSTAAKEDFPASAVGGVFNAVGFTAGVASNVTLQVKNITLETYANTYSSNTSSTCGNAADYSSVGAFAGRNSGNGGKQEDSTYTFNNVQVKNKQENEKGNIGRSAYYAAGLIGSTNCPEVINNNKINGQYGETVSIDNRIILKFTDCSYGNIIVSADCAAGGFLGIRNENLKMQVETENETEETAKDSTIQSNQRNDIDTYVGGVFGFSHEAKITNVKAENIIINSLKGKNDAAIGGLIGYGNGKITIQNATINNAVMESDVRYFGGMVGYARKNGITIENSAISDSKFSGSSNRMGGLVGHASGSEATEATIKSSRIENVTIESTGSSSDGSTSAVVARADIKVTIDATQVNGGTIKTTTKNTGGMIGYTTAETVIQNGSAIKDTNITGNATQSDARTGGMVGRGNKITISGSSVENIQLTGGSGTTEIKNERGTGGMIGDAEGEVTITNSSLTAKQGTLSITGGGVYTGGMIGYANSTATITSSSVSGAEDSALTITGSGTYTGGMIGYGNQKITLSGAAVSSAKVTNSTAKSNGIVTAYISGMAAYANAELDANNVTVSDTTLTITNKDNSNQGINSYSGGVAAFVKGNATINGADIQNLTAQTGKCIGGAAGKLNGTKNSISNAKVFGETKIGSNDITSTAAPQVNGAHNIGGILGTFANRCTISYSSVTDADIQTPKGYHGPGNDINSSAGGMVGEVGSNYTVIFKNCLVKDTSVTAADDTVTANREGSAAGGLVGALYCRMYASNIRIEGTTAATGTTISGNQPQGYLIGKYRINDKGWNTTTTGGVYVAGLSVQKPENGTIDCSKADNEYGLIGLKNEGGTESEVNYIAMADYTGAGAYTVQTAAALFDGTQPASPYANTSPEQGPVIKSTDTSGSVRIFGDGASFTDENGSFVTNAETILGTASGTQYAYAKAKNAIADADTLKTTLSDYNAQNTEKIETARNFPVLLVSGSKTAVNQAITNYVNVITNGGYSEALQSNTGASGGQYVTASVETWAWNSQNYQFVKQTGTLQPAVALRVDDSGKSSMSFAATNGYDNDQQRFTLLAVKFSADGTGSADYTVYVPIIVRRVLQVTTITTLNKGTVFRGDQYNETTLGHLLESTGTAVTALITYTYGQDPSTMQKQDYDWNSLLAAGESMGAPGKKLTFESQSTGGNSNIPAGTQLTLIDKSTKRSYSYTVQPGDISGQTTNVAYAQFKDSDGNAYEEKWFSELMGVTAAEDAGGSWVKAEDSETPGAKAKLDGTLTGFRKYDPETDSAKQRYTLTAPADTETPSEDIYLVIYIPNQPETDGKKFYSNGSLKAQLDTDIKTELTPLLRSDKKTKDSYNNTASTYSILSGYTQDLADNTTVDKGWAKDSAHELEANTDGTLWQMTVDASDTISIEKTQAAFIGNQDDLYYQLQVSLAQYKKVGSSTTLQSVDNLAAGANGTVNFYVTVGNTYYTYDTNTAAWTAVGTTPTRVFGNDISWTSTGDAMQLTFGTDGTEKGAVNLRGLLTMLRDQANAPDTLSFTIRTVFGVITADTGTGTVSMSASGVNMTRDVYQAAIMAAGNMNSENTPDNYTRLNLHGILASTADSLHYSSMTAQKEGDIQYYRKDVNAATIQLTADDIDQLGINCSDLASADGTIDATGVYSLENLSDAEDLLEKAASVRYTLTLEKRLENGSYQQVTGAAAEKYLESLAADSLGKGTFNAGAASWSWTDAKSDSGFALKQGDKNEFQIKLHAKVNTDAANRIVNNSAVIGYANYHLRLKAELLDKNGNVLNNAVNIDKAQNGDNTPGEPGADADATTLYNYNAYYSDYITYTLTKISLDSGDQK